MPSISLDPIAPEEFNRYSDWFNEGASDFLSGAPENLASMFGESARPLAWKLTLDGETLALVTVSVSSSNVGRLNLVVDPRVRRLGVGSALVKELIKQPEVKRLRGLEGEVAASNVAAQKILIKSGFAKVGYSTEGSIKFRLG